jgi:tRNA-specific 2-thiouridylase
MKSEVRQIAAQSGLDYIVKKKESTGICFIGSRNFKNFISQVCSMQNGPGSSVGIVTFNRLDGPGIKS